MKNPRKVKEGKQAKSQGADFERRVKDDLEKKDWFVNRFSNQVEFGYYENCPLEFVPVKWKDLTLKNGEHYPGPVARLVTAKTQWRRTPMGMFPMNVNPGFPDFCCHMRTNFTMKQPVMGKDGNYEAEVYQYKLIGVECKMTGVLDREEKEKCRWLLRNGVFNKILIAEKTKVKNKVVIVYHDFSERYPTKP